MTTLENIGGKPHIIFNIRDARFEVTLRSKKSKVIETINIIDWSGTIKTGYEFVRGRVKGFNNGYTTITDKGLLVDMDFTYINSIWSVLCELTLNDYQSLDGFEEIYMV